jgi:HEAT repeat protein
MDEPESLRVEAVRAVGLLRDKGSVRVLTQRLRDTQGENPESDGVRFESAIALGRIGEKGAVTGLRLRLQSDEETWVVALACQWAVEQITGQPVPVRLTPPTPPRKRYFIHPLREPAGR